MKNLLLTAMLVIATSVVSADPVEREDAIKLEPYCDYLYMNAHIIAAQLHRTKPSPFLDTLAVLYAATVKAHDKHCEPLEGFYKKEL